MTPTPIECLAALYNVTKQASMNYDDHAKAQVYFQTVMTALESSAEEAGEANSTEAPKAFD